MATLLPGHRDPGKAGHRDEVAALWGVDSLPARPGLAALDMFDAVLAGKVKVLWIAATNPAHSMPDQARIRAALQKAEFVIVQEAFSDVETLAYADLVLPAATWPEKDGTLTNSERRVSRVRAAIAPPGDAMADWRLASEVAQRLARRIAPEKAALFGYDGPAAVFAEHISTTRGRDLDYSALTYAELDAHGPQQWPYRNGRSTVRLYADGVYPTPSGRARFVDVPYVAVAEPISAAYPLRLTTGRVRDHWHTMARTSLSMRLNQHVEEPRLSLHPADLPRYRLKDGELARVTSRRGAMIVAVIADTALKPGHAFLPMHWGASFISGAGVNALTNPAADPISLQPELKHSAVAVAPAGLGWQAVAWVKGDANAWRRLLAPWLSRFAFAAILPVSTGGGGVRLRFAADGAPPPGMLHELAGALGLGEPQAAFDDPARGVMRRAQRVEGMGAAFLLAGDTRPENALFAWADGHDCSDGLARLLMGRGTSAPRARIVCACAGVSDQAIAAGIAGGLDLDGLKRSLGCGAGCGSCLSEINGMLRAHARSEALP